MACIQRGFCVNCGTPIPTGILCAECTPVPEVKKVAVTRSTPGRPTPRTPFKKICEMQKGEIGFVNATAIFEAEEKLWAIATLDVSDTPDPYKTVKIKRGRYVIEVDSSTLSRDDIYTDYPVERDDRDYLPALFVPKF